MHSSFSTTERPLTRRRILRRGGIGLLSLLAGSTLRPSISQADDPAEKSDIDFSILTETQWRAIEESIDRAILWLARQQKPTGGFADSGAWEPGVTGLCLLALLSRGHLPGEGPHGDSLLKGVEYVIKSQSPNGLLSRIRSKQAANYNHGIGSLLLSEVYGLTQPTNDLKIKNTIAHCIDYAALRLSSPKAHREDEGGWRYLTRHAVSDSDLSLTSWHLMFLRSARNAGFEIDPRLINDGLEYVKRVFDEGRGTFRYEIYTDDPGYNHTRAMAGAGILSLAMTGEHHSRLARIAADNLLKKPFNQYDHPIPGEKHQCYSAFYCSQAMFHMGGNYWKQFYPQLSATLLKAQMEEGYWRPLSGDDGSFGHPYVTALTILALTAPFQLLPIFQR